MTRDPDPRTVAAMEQLVNALGDQGIEVGFLVLLTVRDGGTQVDHAMHEDALPNSVAGQLRRLARQIERRG